MKFEDKAACFAAAIGNAYRDEAEREVIPKLDLTEDGLTGDFTAMLMALCMLYQGITGDEPDILGFTHILNRLAVQYMMEKGDE